MNPIVLRTHEWAPVHPAQIIQDSLNNLDKRLLLTVCAYHVFSSHNLDPIFYTDSVLRHWCIAVLLKISKFCRLIFIQLSDDHLVEQHINKAIKSEGKSDILRTLTTCAEWFSNSFSSPIISSDSGWKGRWTWTPFSANPSRKIFSIAPWCSVT